MVVLVSNSVWKWKTKLVIRKEESPRKPNPSSKEPSSGSGRFLKPKGTERAMEWDAESSASETCNATSVTANMDAFLRMRWGWG